MKVSLKAARVNAELKQIQVADSMGVPVDRIKYLETKEGSARITYETLLALCSLYGCTPDDIFLPINYPESEVKEVTE
jgi:transcriptional regulator with XRE-family HTH domain